jgi:hypothetical protein
MTRVIPKSLIILLEHTMDYAGLYPPAAVTMRQAINNYNAYLESNWSWMLGKFVVSAAQLEDFLHERKQVSSQTVWELSVLISGHEDFERIEALASLAKLAKIASIELKGSPSVSARLVSPLRPPTRHVYVESPPDQASLEAVQNANYFAKIRMGGVLESAFPDANDVLRFLELCVDLELPFKATAGLHHPLRSSYRLTYDQNSSFGTMYGYLNLLLATAFTLRDDLETARGALLESDASAFYFDDTGVYYDNKRLAIKDLHATRALLRSIGSCSFEEPTRELLAVIA